MEGRRLIHRLWLRDFLSYGSKGAGVELESLNVLIGPNAAGKSNLVEALATLRALPRDMVAHFQAGGGAGEYLWKGDSAQSVRATIAAVVEIPSFPGTAVLEYHLTFAHVVQYTYIVREALLGDPYGTTDGEPYYSFEEGMPSVSVRSLDLEDEVPLGTRYERVLDSPEFRRDQSILAQLRDPYQYPEITYLASHFESIAIYQQWTFGSTNLARLPQRADIRSDFLLPDASNLALVLNNLMQRSATRDKLLAYLQRFYEAAKFISTQIVAGTVQLFIEERGGALISPMRLSDGTLRYLSLLAILCHPTPPPLICIEEPELGLHPDVVPTIAELLKEASQRTQLVVTTHSDALVSALSDLPESVIVCESGSDGTTLRRLDSEKLAVWLEKYTLGELWLSGEIGGTRW